MNCAAPTAFRLFRTPKKFTSQKETTAAKYDIIHKKQLQQSIDRVLPKCNTYKEFLAKIQAEEYKIVDGKNPDFVLFGWNHLT